MTVIDAIIALQQLPPNMKLYIDYTRENSDVFKFGELVSIEEIETDLDGKIGLISNGFYGDEPIDDSFNSN